MSEEAEEWGLFVFKLGLACVLSFAFLWSMNVLFKTMPYTWETWLAGVFLVMLVSNR